jgi:hypothetical protein
MSLANLVQKMFAERDGSIDKPSFYGHEIMLADYDYAVIGQPLSLRTTAERIPAKVVAQDKQVSPGDFAVLSLTEGYFVGGMRRVDCTCGKAPVFIQCNEKSKEPGRENVLLFDELSISRDPSTHIRNGIPVRGNGKYVLSIGGVSLSVIFQAEEKPFLKNRRYEIWTVASKNDAQAYREAFERVKGVKQGARFDSCSLGDRVFCALSAPYVLLMPGQERKSARELILGTFG